jgi:S1/P1 nuclease
MRKLPLAATLLVASVFATDAYAWGDEGHKVVCQIAFDKVKPSTRTAIVKLIQADGEFPSFSDACTWPDHPRKRAGESPHSSRDLRARRTVLNIPQTIIATGLGLFSSESLSIMRWLTVIRTKGPNTMFIGSTGLSA